MKRVLRVIHRVCERVQHVAALQRHQIEPVEDEYDGDECIRRRKDAQRPPKIEPGQRDSARVGVLLEQEGGDQEA